MLRDFNSGSTLLYNFRGLLAIRDMRQAFELSAMEVLHSHGEAGSHRGLTTGNIVVRNIDLRLPSKQKATTHTPDVTLE